MPPLVLTATEAERRRRGRTAGKHTKLLPEEEDPQLREFLEVMKPRQKGKLWSNDDTLGFEQMVGFRAFGGGSRTYSIYCCVVHPCWGLCGSLDAWPLHSWVVEGPYLPLPSLCLPNVFKGRTHASAR